MILYYTTSAGYNQEQLKVNNSLGGYKSSIAVVNDDFNNIFGEITPMTVNRGKPEYIAIILKNETGAIATGAEIWIGSPDNAYSKIEVAIVTTVDDGSGNPKMERVRDTYNRPFMGDFIESDENNKALIGDIDIGQELGIWIKRTVDKEAYLGDNDIPYEKDPDNSKHYIPKELEKSDTFQLNISYN